MPGPRPRRKMPAALPADKPAIARHADAGHPWTRAALIAAFVVPTPLANIFAVLGLAGLLSFRLSVMQPQRRGVHVRRSEMMQ